MKYTARVKSVEEPIMACGTGKTFTSLNIVEKQVERINRLIKDKGEHEKAFKSFLDELKANINPSISQEEAIEMLSQYIITKPVFEALFENYSFVKNNPISGIRR